MAHPFSFVVPNLDIPSTMSAPLYNLKSFPLVLPVRLPLVVPSIPPEVAAPPLVIEIMDPEPAVKTAAEPLAKRRGRIANKNYSITDVLTGRTEHGLSQVVLAQKLHVSVGTVSRTITDGKLYRNRWIIKGSADGEQEAVAPEAVAPEVALVAPLEPRISPYRGGRFQVSMSGVIEQEDGKSVTVLFKSQKEAAELLEVSASAIWAASSRTNGKSKGWILKSIKTDQEDVQLRQDGAVDASTYFGVEEPVVEANTITCGCGGVFRNTAGGRSQHRRSDMHCKWESADETEVATSLLGLKRDLPAIPDPPVAEPVAEPVAAPVEKRAIVYKQFCDFLLKLLRDKTEAIGTPDQKVLFRGVIQEITAEVQARLARQDDARKVYSETFTIIRRRSTAMFGKELVDECTSIVKRRFEMQQLRRAERQAPAAPVAGAEPAKRPRLIAPEEVEKQHALLTNYKQMQNSGLINQAQYDQLVNKVFGFTA